jgi:hypothetical protein
MLKKSKVFISILACLVLGAVSTFFLLHRLGWFLKRSPNVQHIFALGLCLFISAILFSLVYLTNLWVNRFFQIEVGAIPSSRAARVRLAISEIKEQLPFLTKLEEVAQPKRWHWLNMLILTAIPVVLALVNREWLFTIPGEDDPWRYIGLGYYYFNDSGLYSTNYKVSRVPWILIEYVIREIFSPANAEIILGLSFIILGSIGFYLLVSRIFDRRIGFISAALLSTYSYYLVSRSVDYHNAAGSMFLIWSLYFLTLAIQSVKNQRGWFFVTGLVFGIAVHIELVVLCCFPAIIVQFLMLNSGKKRSIWMPILFSLLGFLLVTGLFGVASVLSGRDFFFFMKQLNYVAAYSDLFGTTTHTIANIKWVLQATHLALPFAAFLFAAGWFVRNLVKFLQSNLTINRNNWLQTGFYLQFTLVGLVWLIGSRIQVEMLGGYYFIQPLYIYTFLAFAGFLAAVRQYKFNSVILGVVPVVVCGTLAFSDNIFSIIGAQFLTSRPVIQPLLFYLFIFSCLILFRRSELATLLIVVLMGLGNVMSIYTGPDLTHITLSQISLDQNQCHVREDGYVSAIDITQRLWDLGSHRTHLWWDANEVIPAPNCHATEASLAKIGLSVTRIGIQKMKDNVHSPPIDKIPAAYYRQLAQRKDVVAVITNNLSTEKQMLAKLRTYGNWSLARQDTIVQGEIQFSLYVFTMDGKIP